MSDRESETCFHIWTGMDTKCKLGIGLVISCFVKLYVLVLNMMDRDRR